MKKLFLKIKLLFGKAKRIAKESIEPAIKVTNIVKDLVENPLLNVAVQITPFKWDDLGLQVAKKSLPILLLELQVLKGLDGKSGHEVVAAIVNEIRQYTPDKQAQFYEDLAVKISYFLSDGKIDISELRELSKYIYDTKFRNK